MRVKFFMQWIACLIVAGWAGSAMGADAPVRVFVSVLPQKTFVERIGGDRVDVSVLVSPGESPATYRPKPSLVAKLASADLYFRVGVPFEGHLLPKIASVAKNLIIVDTRLGVPLRIMEEAHHHDEEAHHDESHGEDEPGEQEGSDPHIWLDPMRVKIQAHTMMDALIAADPVGETIYRKGFSDFTRELDALDRDVREALAPLKGATLYVYHPAFGYFADAYGMVQKAVEVSGKRPKGRALSSFISSAKADGVKVIFVQPQFDRNAANKIARAIGGAVIPLDPLAADYLGNLRAMAEAVISNR